MLTNTGQMGSPLYRGPVPGSNPGGGTSPFSGFFGNVPMMGGPGMAGGWSGGPLPSGGTPLPSGGTPISSLPAPAPSGGAKASLTPGGTPGMPQPMPFRGGPGPMMRPMPVNPNPQPPPQPGYGQPGGPIGPTYMGGGSPMTAGIGPGPASFRIPTTATPPMVSAGNRPNLANQMVMANALRRGPLA